MRGFVVVMLAALAGAPLVAEGAGGVEFFQVVGRDLWPLPGGSGLMETTGVIGAVGGLGYGVDEDGLVTGGFGMGVTSDTGLHPGPDFHAGYGGTLHGWQHRWGPLVGLFTTRLGFGGQEWNGQGGFSLLGMAGAQFALTLTPWFAVGVEAGGAGTVTFLTGAPFQLRYAPTVALRLLWGAF